MGAGEEAAAVPVRFGLLFACCRTENCRGLYNHQDLLIADDHLAAVAWSRFLWDFLSICLAVMDYSLFQRRLLKLISGLPKEPHW